MIRARSTRLIGSVRDREISSKRRRCSASVGSAITRRGATIGSPNPIPARLLPHLVQNAESRPNILIYRNLYTRMTQHQLPASLYAPLRVVLYESEAGHAVFEYDRPSSLFGQFGDERVTAVARELDASLERVLAQALHSGEER